MGLLLGLPVWPEAGAIALGLESIRGHDPESRFEDEPTEQAAPSEEQAMIIAPAETLGELALPPEQAWQTTATTSSTANLVAGAARPRRGLSRRMGSDLRGGSLRRAQRDASSRCPRQADRVARASVGERLVVQFRSS